MTDIRVLNDWMDQHHITVVRTHATNLEGTGVGKHLNRKKFISYLPKGHAIGDVAPIMDRTGSEYLTIPSPTQTANFGDVYMRPDLDTLIYDGADPDLGHCMADFTDADGNPLVLCPRSLLKSQVARLAEKGLTAKCTFELEFFLFSESFNDLRAAKYQRKTPVTAVTQGPGIYNIRNAYVVKPFMKELVRRMEWQGIEWEGWNDENGSGQVELNLVPQEPVKMADTVIRVKQMAFEVATDMDLSATFMASVGASFGSGMHIHHSLTNKDGESAFYAEGGEHKRSELMDHWLAGILQVLPAAVSLFCPSINAFRRLRDFNAVPLTRTWGEDNRSTAIRVITGSPAATRIEQRLAASDVNPYLALATLFAGGLAGLEGELKLQPEHQGLAWGLPPSDLDLPTTIREAAKITQESELLQNAFGEEVITYWAKTREQEWLAFHTEGGDPSSREPTFWEYQRYFEHA